MDTNWNIKIADFGLSCAKNHTSSDAQCSLLWTSPEILSQEPNCYSEKSDLYAYYFSLNIISIMMIYILFRCAIIFWEMISRQNPFHDVEPAAVLRAIVTGNY